MPIQVQDFEWSQTSTIIQIKVPLKGVPGHKADIFSTNEYIKVSFPPYIFEVFLAAPVEDSKSKATISSGQITFQLEKKEPDVIWEHIQHEKFKEKGFSKMKRDEAVAFSQERALRQQERRATERDQQQKFAVKQQMRVEEEERSKIKAVKDKEIKRTNNELEDWKTAAGNENQDDISMASSGTPTGEELFSQNGGKNDSRQKQEKKAKESRSIPPPRAAGTIQLKFTPRAFVTPSRESKAPEEEAWLEKVAEMKKIKADTQTKMDMEEMNPTWLKDKGRNFYKQENFIAAINAFTAAIVLNSSDPSYLFALNLLDPPVPANAKSRSIALIRRGTAHFKAEDFVPALSDYEAALKIEPNNESVRNDADKIRKIIQGC
eukprot:gene12547-3242_t